MALIKCKECGEEVSSKAEACPKCGYKNKKGMGCGSIVLLGFLALALISALLPSQTKNGSSSSPNPSADTTTPLPQALPSAPGAQWNYLAFADEMGKGNAYQAHVVSSNTVNFDFPYKGPQHGELTLRDHPRYGKDIIFSIEKGQILCRSYEECIVLVRFDDEEPLKFSAIGPADNSSEHVFIKNYDRFLQKMLQAKTVRISVDIYQEGAPVFIFDISDFDDMKFKPRTQ